MICVVGAVALDILVRRERFVRGTSNPSSIRLEPGGVGYRIFAGLPEPKRLYTALGADLFGRWLAEQISDRQQLQPVFLERYPTACYCALMEAGTLLYGAADMAVIQEGLAWPQLRARLPELGPRDMLVLEANLSPALVRTLVRRYGRRTRVVFEAVSVEKLLRHRQGLEDLFLLCANGEELKALGRAWTADLQARLEAPPAGIPVRHSDLKGDRWVASFMNERRIAHLLVPRGPRGVRLYSAAAGATPQRVDLAPRRVISARDTTGAGDRLLAAVLEQADSVEVLAEALPAALETTARALRERP